MKTKILCKLYGGSHLYGLNTSESDIDERGVFMHLDPSYILGTKRFDEERKQPQDTDEDIVLKELSHFCSLLRKSNSEALELLFCESDNFLEYSFEFDLLRAWRTSFIDPKNLFSCLRGYMQSERRLMNGERKGQIGGKRYAKLQEVGYSPKNAVQLLRLGNLGIQFFKTRQFIVDTRRFPEKLHNTLYTIKTQPELYSSETVNEMVTECEQRLVDAFEGRNFDYTFDEGLLNKVLFKIYMPILNNYAYERIF